MRYQDLTAEQFWDLMTVIYGCSNRAANEAKESEIPAMVFSFNPIDHQFGLVPTDGRDAIRFAIDHFMHVMKNQVPVLISEAWFVKTALNSEDADKLASGEIRASEHPNRSSVIQTTICFEDGSVLMTFHLSHNTPHPDRHVVEATFLGEPDLAGGLIPRRRTGIAAKIGSEIRVQ
jgi:hypothetical protein